jgi:hypothetical protein
MHGSPAMVGQFINPIWRQVHIDQNLDTHAVAKGTSRSSMRHAA